ncbi:MAG TPA: hypothetical protein VNO79_08720, partial [Actinomycetota bacterium]|nr:hypothetical protein [Actinomycetota bacterium]
LAGGLALTLALGLVWVRGRIPAPLPGPSAEPLALRGRLVYAADVARRHQRLWVLELGTGRLRAGPRIPRATDLVASTGGWGTWIAFLSRSPRGGVRAFVLRDLGPGARPELVGSGDLAAWGPQATSLVLARRGPLVDACHRAVAVVFLTVEPRSRTAVYRDPALCGDVLSVGRDQASTYFTVAARSGGGIFIPGYQRRPHPVLPGHAILSAAPTGRMLVAPLDRRPGRGGIGPWGARADRDPPPPSVAGPAAVWSGVGRPAPVALGPDRLVVGRVLAWSPSASRALVVGVLHDLLGVFALDTSADAADRSPRLVTELRGAVGATFSRDGTALIAMGGRLYAVREGGLRDVPLPEGAPVPSGPVVWLP